MDVLPFLGPCRPGPLHASGLEGAAKRGKLSPPAPGGPIEYMRAEKCRPEREPPVKGDWAQAYERLQPVLFAVLRRLARQGYLASASQGLDSVHDFFVEAWPGINERYDPAKGSLEGYVAVAFTRFVRPRLVSEARWRASLGLQRDVAAASSAAGDLESIDLDRVRQALQELDPADRDLLWTRFGASRVSERRLAAQLGTTRYKVRERVAVAVARLAGALGERGVLSEPDFRVARLLFIEGRSVAGTAAALSLSEPQVRAAQRRVVAILGRASVEATS
jgi:RNA polymerase sigma factor (sigma-70 family)